MSNLNLDDTNFHKEIKESKVPVMVDFYADWCGPCKRMSPTIQQLSDEYNGKIKVFKLNVDNSREIAGEYGVQSIPTVIFFKNGEKVDQFVGAMPKTSIEEHIKKLI